MNYFAHYFFDHSHHSEIHNFGLVLPDFVRNFIKGKRLKPSPQKAFEHKELQLLHEGTLKHIDRDAQFHGSKFFKEASVQLGNLIRPAFIEAGIPRVWWGAHLLTEMMLDRVLIQENPVLIGRFYEDLENTSETIVGMYMEQNGIAETTDFFSRLARFRELRYLLRYTEDEAMVFSLGRVYLYAGVSAEWNHQQAAPLIPLMKPAENAISTLVSQLKDEML